MIVGVLSDTHDNLPKIEKAVRLFNRKKVGSCLHAGDYVAPFVIDKLVKLSCPWQGVFGNNDGEKKGLALKSAGAIVEPPLRLKLDGRRVTLIHDIAAIDAQAEAADIVIFGHSHRPEVRRDAGKLFVNPGECCGWLSGRSTVALLDLQKITAVIIRL
ncbi:MAG: metallophosphoesterase [Candidatus Omnitrophica bacterium]|nr:metallophosphoesterase [Candidatus Omnitrophota bacterium]